MLVQVRFVVETKVRIYPGQERFWYYTRKVVARRWRLVVRRLEEGEGLQLVEVVQGEEVQPASQGRMSALTSQLATSAMPGASYVAIALTNILLRLHTIYQGIIQNK